MGGFNGWDMSMMLTGTAIATIRVNNDLVYVQDSLLLKGM